MRARRPSPSSSGAALHRVLEALLARDALPPRSDAPMRALMSATLRELSCESSLIDGLLERASGELDRMLADDWTRWMLSPERPWRRAEMPLSLVCDGHRQQLILDYSFLDETRGERWVIDYKTASPAEGETLDAFFERQREKYRPQLENYRQAMAAIFPEPLRCALYFPAIGQRCEVATAPT